LSWGSRRPVRWSTAVPALRFYSAANADAQTFSGVFTLIGQPFIFSTLFMHEKVVGQRPTTASSPLYVPTLPQDTMHKASAGVSTSSERSEFIEANEKTNMNEIIGQPLSFSTYLCKKKLLVSD
jgi:hypothetical protein